MKYIFEVVDIFEVVVACLLLLLFVALFYYVGKYPLKKSIVYGLLYWLVAAILLELTYLMDDPYTLIAMNWITMFVLCYLSARYIGKMSLKESIKASLIMGTFIAIILPLVGKLLVFLRDLIV